MSTVERWREIFEGHGADYEFTMSGVAIGGRGVTVEIVAGKYLLTHDAYVGVGTSMEEAVLRLIAVRLDVVL